MPDAVFLAAFVRMSSTIAVKITFGQLDRPDEVSLFDVCGLDAPIFCDFPDFLHFHDESSPCD
jgi:hypothetical protein